MRKTTEQKPKYWRMINPKWIYVYVCVELSMEWALAGERTATHGMNAANTMLLERKKTPICG